jgi:hypothetical protein
MGTHLYWPPSALSGKTRSHAMWGSPELPLRLVQGRYRPTSGGHPTGVQGRSPRQQDLYTRSEDGIQGRREQVSPVLLRGRKNHSRGLRHHHVQEERRDLPEIVQGDHYPVPHHQGQRSQVGQHHPVPQWSCCTPRGRCGQRRTRRIASLGHEGTEMSELDEPHVPRTCKAPPSQVHVPSRGRPRGGHYPGGAERDQ